MTKSQHPAKNGRYWLIGAVVLCAIGISLGLFSLMMVGASVSGSGCGSQCEDSTMTFVVASQLFLGLAMAVALISVILTWLTQTPAQQYRPGTTITFINLFVILAAGFSFAVLSGL